MTSSLSSILPTIIATGGAVSLAIRSTGNTTLSRAVSGVSGVGPYTPLWNAGPLELYIDPGDGLPGPLSPASLYVYKLTDDNGTIVTAPVQPSVELNPQIEPLTQMMLKLLQAAVTSLTLPNGVKKATVLQAMPNGQNLPLPFFVLNLDLMQQAEIPIGQSAWKIRNDGSAVVTAQIHRMYKLSILSDNAVERDIYRDLIPPVFEVILSQVLAPAGLDVSHHFQIASGQVAEDRMGKSPGFYFADALIEFNGTLNMSIQTNLGLIAEIDFKAFTPDGQYTEVIVPTT